MKDFKGKFDILAEDTVYRFQNGGFSPHDIVKISKNALSNPKIKNMSGQYKDQIKAMMETDLNLRVGSVKSTRPTTTQNYNGMTTDAPYDFFVDVVIEQAPGIWSNPITLPIEVLERVETGNDWAPVPESLKRKSKITKQAKLESSDKERRNPEKNTKLEHSPEPEDGRKQAKKPIAYKESLENVYQGMLLSEAGYEDVMNPDDNIQLFVTNGKHIEYIGSQEHRQHGFSGYEQVPFKGRFNFSKNIVSIIGRDPNMPVPDSVMRLIQSEFPGAKIEQGNTFELGENFNVHRNLHDLLKVANQLEPAVLLRRLNVDKKSVQVADIEDYPDFADAHIVAAKHNDGTDLNESELDILNQNNELIYFYAQQEHTARNAVKADITHDITMER